jgi:hypothetical protein
MVTVDKCVKKMKTEKEIKHKVAQLMKRYNKIKTLQESGAHIPFVEKLKLSINVARFVSELNHLGWVLGLPKVEHLNLYASPSVNSAVKENSKKKTVSGIVLKNKTKKDGLVRKPKRK